MTLQPLRHPDFQKLDDAAFDLAAKQYASRTGAIQFLTELIERLRTFSWWNPNELRQIWGAAERMAWFRERPDIRQRVTTALTGLAPRAARNKTPEFQASLIDSVIEDGDVPVIAFEEAFYPIEIALYGPAPLIWKQFRDRMPWRDESPANRALVEWILDEFLASKSRVYDWKRKSILSAHAFRVAVPGRIWHQHVPIDLRIAVDDARLERERTKPTEPFHATHELQIVTPQVLAAHLPLRELVRVFDAAEREMGLSLAPPAGSVVGSPTPGTPGIAGPSPVGQGLAGPSVGPQVASGFIAPQGAPSVAALPAVGIGRPPSQGVSVAQPPLRRDGPSAPNQPVHPGAGGSAAGQAGVQGSGGQSGATTVPPGAETDGTDIPVSDEDFAFNDV